MHWYDNMHIFSLKAGIKLRILTYHTYTKQDYHNYYKIEIQYSIWVYCNLNLNHSYIKAPLHHLLCINSSKAEIHDSSKVWQRFGDMGTSIEWYAHKQLEKTKWYNWTACSSKWSMALAGLYCDSRGYELLFSVGGGL